MTDKPLNKDDTPVGYGSLYMNNGEKFAKAEPQIRNVSSNDPFMWFFDIICTQNQIPAANDMALEVTALIRECCPKMKDLAIVIGVTTKDTEWPARLLMERIARKYSGNKLEGMELSSGKRFLWVGGEQRK